MIVYFYATGYMKTHLNESSYSVELGDCSTIADFFIEIDRTMGQDLSKVIWNHKKRCFRGPVTIKVEGKAVNHENYCLLDGQTIEISRILIGG